MTDRKFNLTIGPMWENRMGFMSMPVNEEMFDALQEVEKGGKLVFKLLGEDSRKSEKSPHGYLEYISKDEVEAFAASRSTRPEKAAAPKAKKAVKSPPEDSL